MNHQVVKIGLLGLGTVGSGVVKFLRQQAEELARKSGYKVEIKKILVRDLLKKRRVDVPRELLTQNVWEIVQDPEIQIVIEVMGGERETKDYVQAALEIGKHVITANKDLIALHSPELYRVAESNGCELLYEAAVAGAIPIVRVMKQSFAADRIHEVMGIVNGTTNFILSKMAGEGVAYEDALREAQELGYAEANPFADVSGLDAARKMAILGSIAFDRPIALSDVQVSGIADVTQADVLRAREQQAVIKLIGRARREESGPITVEVKPMLLPASHPLAGVSDCFNAVYVYGEALGEAMFYGRGAGEFPTASAVVGDLLAVLRGRKFVASARPLPIANV